MELLETRKFIHKQCGSAISMRGWKGEYWLGDAMGAPKKLEDYMHSQNSTLFSLIRHDFQQHAVTDMFFWNDMKSWTPGKILSREDQGLTKVLWPLLARLVCLTPFSLAKFSQNWSNRYLEETLIHLDVSKEPEFPATFPFSQPNAS